MSKGCVAAGNQRTVDAGLYAFKKGGNAIDALIASQLAATVVEPLLTGLGGAGIAVMKAKNDYHSLDMFTSMPGMGTTQQTLPRMDEVFIDFGPTRQTFNVGLGSVAVPTIAKGLIELHKRFSTLPMSVLAAPAVDYARTGFIVTPHFEKVIELLWPICQKTSEMKALFSGKDGRLRAGESFNPVGMAEDILEFVELGPDFLIKGRLGEALRLMSREHDEMLLGLEDIEHYQVQKRQMAKIKFNSACVRTASPPSVGGALIEENLLRYNNLEFPENPYGLNLMKILIQVQREVDVIRRDKRFIEKIIKNSNKYLNFNGNSLGNTTHISVVDKNGYAAGITSSLGESCGAVISGSQLILNNFLGESDVAPAQAIEDIGGRLITMCSPTIMENQSGVYVLGSGGSSRIPTAVLHGILFLEMYGHSVQDAVSAPRLHVENAAINVESDGRESTDLGAMHMLYGDALNQFDGPNMYFGGLHVAAYVGGDTLVGSGDPRRSGAVGIV